MNMASTEIVVCLLMLAFGTRGASSAAGKSYSALSSLRSRTSFQEIGYWR